MRVLLDENLPLRLAAEFEGHECSHVISLGWAGTKNGELLDLARREGFDVLITFDHGIPKDHDISNQAVSVFVLKPQGQGLPAVRALLGEVLAALEVWQPGQVRVFTNRG
jgi:hypothetical protein